MIKSWSYTEEYKDLRKKILKSIDKSIKSGKIFFGHELKKFEKDFLKKNNLRYGVAVGSGTDAIYLALLSLKIGYGDEVITVANTAIPTVSAIISAGAKVKFVDINNSYLMDPEKIEKQITKKTKAIIPVHLYGQSCDMYRINKIAKKYKLKVIEDCAQAQGAKFNGKNVGSFGDAGCFSFYPTKILGAYGDGGFVSTNSKDLCDKIAKIRFYGIEQNNTKNKFNKKYYSNLHGVNSRISEMQAAILNLKLPKVNAWIKKRRNLAKLYIRELKYTSLKLPYESKVYNCKHVYHLFAVYHPKRDLIIKKLRKYKIYVNINYPFPIHKMKGYAKVAPNKHLPISEKFAKGIFSLPMYPKFKTSNLLKVTKALKKILGKI